MRIDGSILSLSLLTGAHLRLCDASGVTIRNTKGVLWVTQTGDLADHFIEPGCAFILERKGITIVSAMTDAHFSFEKTSACDFWINTEISRFFVLAGYLLRLVRQLGVFLERIESELRRRRV